MRNNYRGTNQPFICKVYSFSPSGLTFTKPVQIIFKYDPGTLSPGISEADLYIGILNDNFEIVEILQDSTVDAINKLVTATTLHFSNFAVGSPTNFSNVSPPAASELLRFKVPVNNVIWGQYSYDYTTIWGNHTGIDLTGDSSIRSTAFGKVVWVQPNDPTSCTDHGLGNAVIIEHYRPKPDEDKPAKIYSLYGHMKSVSVQSGQWVKQREEIGIMGGTGNTWQYPVGKPRKCTPKNWPVHLHFELKDSPLEGRTYLQNPSGDGIHYGYILPPDNPDNFGYHNPADYFDKREVQVAFLAKAEDSFDVFWIQNGKRYHVLEGIIEKMSGLPTWGWDKVAKYPSDVINQFEFHQKNIIEPNGNSDGLLIRQVNTSEVYLIENGRKRQITSIDEFNQMGLDWNDVIIVTQEIMSLFVSPPPPPQGQIVLQPGPGAKQIWTSSVYSFTGAGGGPGGGLYDETLRVGGWGDLYYTLMQFDLSGLPPVALSAKIELFVSSQGGGTETPMYLDRITQFWDWRTQGAGSDKITALVGRPSIGAPVDIRYLPGATVGQWYSIDITDLYNA